VDDQTSKLLGETVPKIKLKDILLNKSNFEFPGKGDLEKLEDVRIQNKKDIKYTLQDTELESGEKDISLYVYVNLGVRVAGKNEQQEEETVFYIEAEYLAIYHVKEKIENPAIEAFAEFNSVHNVWPFWRQNVFDIVSRAKLPHIDIPLFTGADS